MKDSSLLATAVLAGVAGSLLASWLFPARDASCTCGNGGQTPTSVASTASASDQLWELGEEMERPRPMTSNFRPKRIILIRHGESEANRDPTLYSRMPDNKIPLTDLGHEQAREAGRTLKQLIGNESVRFYVSPFRRTYETYEEIVKSFEENHLSFREDPRIRELEFGNYQDAARMDAIRKERHEVGPFYYRFEGGESGGDVFQRVSSFLESMFRDFEKHQDDNYILVGHGLTTRLFLMRYFHWPVKVFHKLANPRNCEFHVMESQPNNTFVLITRLATYPESTRRRAATGTDRDDSIEIVQDDHGGGYIESDEDEEEAGVAGGELSFANEGDDPDFQVDPTSRAITKAPDGFKKTGGVPVEEISSSPMPEPTADVAVMPANGRAALPPKSHTRLGMLPPHLRGRPRKDTIH